MRCRLLATGSLVVLLAALWIPVAAGAAPRLTTRLVLANSVVAAGTPIRGTLLVTNHDRRPALERGCRDDVIVALWGVSYRPTIAVSAVACISSTRFDHGATRLVFTVATTYLSCSTQASQASPRSPLCLPGPALPPLPPGQYSAQLFTPGLALPTPTPTAVALT